MIRTFKTKASNYMDGSQQSHKHGAVNRAIGVDRSGIISMIPKHVTIETRDACEVVAGSIARPNCMS